MNLKKVLRMKMATLFLSSCMYIFLLNHEYETAWQTSADYKKENTYCTLFTTLERSLLFPNFLMEWFCLFSRNKKFSIDIQMGI